MKYRWSPAFLAINTPYDEADRSLSGLSGSPNPFLAAKKSTTLVNKLRSFFSDFAQVLESIRGSLAGKILNTLNNGGALLPTVLIALFLLFVGLTWRPFFATVTDSPLSDPALSMAFLVTITLLLLVSCFFRRRFGHAILLPGILVANMVPVLFKFVFNMLTVVFDTVVKNALWSLLKSLSRGISSAPRKAEDINVNLVPGGDNLYLELPIKIVEIVKKQQELHLYKIQEILYQADIKWTPGELREQLEGKDFPMIHTTYYRNLDCI